MARRGPSGGETYRTRHGVDWPAGMADEFIDMTVAKKWREFESEYGITFPDPWVPLIGAARRLVPEGEFRVSEWTETHFHDFVMEDKLVTWGCASSGKAQPLDEPVLTPSGYRPMGEVKGGDEVIGGDGRPVRVLRVHDFPALPEWVVTFSDMTAVRCAGDHLWDLRKFHPEGGRILVETRDIPSLAGRMTLSLPVAPVVSPETADARRAELDAILWRGRRGRGRRPRAATVRCRTVTEAGRVAELARGLGLHAYVSSHPRVTVTVSGLGSRPPARRVVSAQVTGRIVPMRCIVVDAVPGIYLTRSCVPTHNSNDTALLVLLDWAVDPYDTVTLVGSTTKQDLKSRIWEAIVRYHNALRRNPLGLAFPGKVLRQGQAVVNVEDDGVGASAGEKAGIQGRALNEDGRLQGAHAKYVRLVVDELAEIANHDAIAVAMANLRVGTRSFKFVGLANPASWDNPSCRYCIPPDGPGSVNVDTGSWRSTFGAFVRHHDGLKSPCVLHPELAGKYPFLMTRSAVDAVLAEAGGNSDAPQFWKMVRGFPVPSGDTIPTVLDSQLAARAGAESPGDPNDVQVAAVAGIDPAWTEGGDGAVRARARIRRGAGGRDYLDFTGGVERLAIRATDPRPPVQQMRDETIAMMRRENEAPFRLTAVDASANQGLADDLVIYAGADLLPVNSSQRASDSPLRAAGDVRPARETVYDRGTEAWCVLAEFVRAGQVRGLPEAVMRALTMRRYAMSTSRVGGQSVVTGPKFPLRLEDKASFRKRYGRSPDEADACALAALVAKERAGLVPYSYVSRVDPSAYGSVRRAPGVNVPDEDFSSMDGTWDSGFALDPDFGF